MFIDIIRESDLFHSIRKSLDYDINDWNKDNLFIIAL